MCGWGLNKKGGTENQALGRSRGGFSTKIHIKYLDKIKSILFSAIVRSSSSDLSGLSRLAVG